jgi:hypothetical protein
MQTTRVPDIPNPKKPWCQCPTRIKRLPTRFYRAANGREPISEWPTGLELADRRLIGEDITDVAFSWPIGMPLVRFLGHRLWKIRYTLPPDRITRVPYCIIAFQMILLHGLIKKSRPPKQDLDLALRRMRGNYPE